MSTVRVVAVGDISFGDNAVCASFGIESMLRTRPGLDMFQHVKEILQGHDVVFGNLETVLSDEGLVPASLRSRHMRGRPASVGQLANAGFNVVNVANNHILQHGKGPFEETVELLRSTGIIPVGVAGRGNFHCEPARIDVRGTEVVFLGYGLEKDKYYRGDTLYAQADLSGIVEDIRRVKTRDTVVVCSLHWGSEFVSYPSRKQVTMGRSMVEAGCDLVLGHHPHVLNGFEFYRGALVFYSLGNFVFDQLWFDDCTRSMAVHVALSPGAAQFIGADAVRIGEDYRPVSVDDPCFADALQRLCTRIQEATSGEETAHTLEASRREIRNRYLSWMFLLRHLYRYDPVILRQILAEALKRRLPRAHEHRSAAEGA